MTKHRPPPDSRTVIDMRAAGVTISDIAQTLDCSRSAVEKIIREEGIATGTAAPREERPAPTRNQLRIWNQQHLADLHAAHGIGA